MSSVESWHLFKFGYPGFSCAHLGFLPTFGVLSVSQLPTSPCCCLIYLCFIFILMHIIGIHAVLGLNMLLEQLSRLPHAPSVPFQTTPPITKVPEEEEEDMDKRPKPRIWNGEDCESDPDEDEKPRAQFSNTNHHPTSNVEMR
ncbi:Histone deacetylase 6 [Vitis vinifera]|uniref:Histone deacetylase 6 n=1 Tax=Vitis vinifera TaxID=29760 RepID=A0A438EZ38_VITVI|nr:Histone deacetylase 6 [Vitis vinifera]